MNDGFFKKGDLAKMSTGPSPAKRKGRVGGCSGCGFDKDCESPRMAAFGDGEQQILIVADAPSSEDDAEGKPFSDSVGKYLRRTLRAMSIDVNRDCRTIHAIACRIPSKATKAQKEKAPLNCRHRVLKEIQDFGPKVILLLGTPAIQSVIGHTWHESPGGVFQWRGMCVPDQTYKAWICPVYTPLFVRQMDEVNGAVDTIWRQDLKAVRSHLTYPVPDYGDPRTQVVRIRSLEDIRSLLNRLSDNPPRRMAVDFETTGKKPYRKGHRIVSASVCYDKNEAFSFLTPAEIYPRLRRVLSNPSIDKAAHNMKFEILWSRIILGMKRVVGWAWDSMLAAHFIDNRTGTTGLKYQSYATFGLPEYDQHLEPLLRIVGNDSNGFNQIDEIPIDDLLLYGGIDALNTFRLANRQDRDVSQLREEVRT